MSGVERVRLAQYGVIVKVLTDALKINPANTAAAGALRAIFAERGRHEDQQKSAGVCES